MQAVIFTYVIMIIHIKGRIERCDIHMYPNAGILIEFAPLDD